VSSPAAGPETPGGSQRIPEPAIVFLGDSLTAGYGLASGESMPSLIQHRLAAAQRAYRVINAGRSGDTTAAGLARLSQYLRRELHVRLLVIALGSNDALRLVPTDRIEANLREMVQRTRRFDPGIRILLCQLHTHPLLGRDYARRFGELFPRVAAEEGLVLLPFILEGVALVTHLNLPDGLHPNAAGTRVVAENVWNALVTYL
jgi:acyl-CoA thioesterase-1